MPDEARLNDEPARLAALDRLDVMNTVPEAQFEKIVDLVSTVLGVPIVTVTLVSGDRQWFKARRAMPLAETPRATSFCTHTIAAYEPLVIADAAADPRFADNPMVVGEPFIRAYAGVPLTMPDGYNVGALCAIDTTPRTFGASEIDLLKSFASLVVDELELRQIARTDPLTGALTRRGLMDALQQEIDRGARYGRSAALVLLDIDHFKPINDTHGHPAGDAVLRELVARIEGSLRPNDRIGRLGGEEFAVLLPETDGPTAQIVAERMRTTVADSPFPAGSASIDVTASFGIAALGANISNADDWLKRADAPLYEAKRAGRNRCLSYDAVTRAAA